ncbi:MAG: 1-deoxy-D-xylulose-5-phosphate synthase [Deltaproteobacteria bacterium]|nr:1-deoxy-D-xylulose-5-phosphate synthase [Deltaproteobacteria bacterium]
MSEILNSIDSPEDLRKLPEARLPEVATAVRSAIIDTISRTGGHLAAGLGAVELTVALHYVFDTPRDRLIWDVGHQGYPHKMLTGRRKAFGTIGAKDGMGKFLRRQESEYDVFGAGHAGTSISAATGIAEAIRRRGGREKVVAVIGDGAMTAGMAYEGLNNAGYLRLSNLIVVLNDNEMSISKNVGALTSFLARRWSAPQTRRLKHALKSFLESIPRAGDELVEMARRAEQSFKGFISPAHLFEGLGFNYIGPIDGHDLPQLVETFRNARDIESNEHPVLIHCRTEKGYGYEYSQADPVKYHGVEQFEVSSGAMKKSTPGAPSWTGAFADALIELAKDDPRIVGITAAMSGGTGLDKFQASFPDRFYDVGIAEQHAVTFAAGLATEGLKPVCAIYSTFLQRAYDQIVHDVCLQGLGVTFVLDRAGLVGADGATHQGFYDIAYLRALPNIVLMAPKDENELRQMLKTAIEYPGPAALRIPRGAALGVPLDNDVKSLAIGEAELLRDGRDLGIVALGHSVAPALDAAERLSEHGISAAVLNARFAKPVDVGRIGELARRCGALLVVEEHSAIGGMGDAVLAALAEQRISIPVRELGIPDRVIEHGSQAEWREALGIDAAGIERAARELLGR